MKKHFYSADYIFINEKLRQDLVIVTDEDDCILDILPNTVIDPSLIHYYKGALVPGLVNTHCHLELSHMLGRVHTGTTLLPFLNSVVSMRDVDPEQIGQAIIDADREMYHAGIVACGDISNKMDTASVKSTSKIAYHTFVEMFDFLTDDSSQTFFDQYLAVYEGQSNHGRNKKSMVPHAPYTVSKSLFSKINAANPSGITVSIHNQETIEENLLFESKTGGFIDMFKKFNVNLDAFNPIGKGSIYYALENMDPTHKTLFVHNTMSTVDDIKAAYDWNPRSYFATCPNANLYIENRLPNYQAFIDTNALVTIGTDSLTSNWQLSIAEEIITIQKYCSYVPLETCLLWATKNGAEALGYSDELGSIEIGKKPGLVNLEIKKIGHEFKMISNVAIRVV
jgi:aminodeoxyfutalosine deaminase